MKFSAPACVVAVTLALFACGGDPTPSEEATGGAGAAAARDVASESSQLPADLPRFTPPEGWVRRPPSNDMRLHEFALPGDDGAEDGLVVVAAWPGGIGSADENARRWAMQMGLDDVPAGARRDEDVRGFTVTTVELEGALTEMGATAAREGAGMLASLISRPGEVRAWTVKATGPAVTLARWKDSYAGFVAGL